MEVWMQLIWLLVLALPVATIAWTVTHEEIFLEPREYCQDRCQNCEVWYKRKFFYLFTCEFCFSYYMSLLVIITTDFKMLYTNWRGYVIALFALVWIANVYMSIYARLRLDIKKDRIDIAVKEEVLSGNTDAATTPMEVAAAQAAQTAQSTQVAPTGRAAPSA